MNLAVVKYDWYDPNTESERGWKMSALAGSGTYPCGYTATPYA